MNTISNAYNSSDTVHSIFFSHRENQDNILELLDKYMYKIKTIENIEDVSALPSNNTDISYDPIITAPEPIIINTPVTEPIVHEYISPKQQDTLFWCLYIAMFGYNDYLQVSRNYGVKELEIKQKAGNWIQKNQDKMKHTNIKVTKAAVQEILSDLLTSVKDTGILTMLGLIVYFNIQVVLIDPARKLMVEFKAVKDSELTAYLLEKDSYGKYKLRAESISQDEIISLKTTNYCLENYLKPLKPVSTYHVEDLKQIATLLGIFDEHHKYKKPELYQQLSDLTAWK
jgi:hypothetical protein